MMSQRRRHVKDGHVPAFHVERRCPHKIDPTSADNRNTQDSMSSGLCPRVVASRVLLCASIWK
eukprot:7604564-Heterocapsa_arctica.AAC.1